MSNADETTANETDTTADDCEEARVIDWEAERLAGERDW